MDSKKRGEFYEKNIMYSSYSCDAVYHDTGRLSFRSQNENVAVIDGEGTVTGKNTGTAVIRVTAEENNNYHAATKELYITVTTAVSGETDQNNDSVDSPEENKTSADSVFEKI